VPEVPGGGNIIFYIDVCLRYRVGEYYCVHWCVSELQCEGIITMYSVVFLMYLVR